MKTVNLVGWMMFIAAVSLTNAQGKESPKSDDFSKPFEPDEHTVVLYHFDEGKGEQSYDACGDTALTLRAYKKALWGARPGFGATARFKRREDDANILVGPTNNDKLQLRTCTAAWTIEAWVRYTGPWGEDAAGNTYANICGSDEEGVSLPEGLRGGSHFALHTSRVEEGLAPHARFIGSLTRCPDNDVNAISPYYKPGGDTGVRPATIKDQQWHHVAWQFRYEDQTHFMFIDGRLIWKYRKPDGRSVINDAERCDVPFVVGGFLHADDPPFRLGRFEGEIDEIRISNMMRYPVAEKLSIVRCDLPDAALKMPFRVALSAEAGQGRVTWKLVDGELPPGLDFDEENGTLHGIPTEIADEVQLTIGATDAAGKSDTHSFTISVRPGQMASESLPVAFVGHEYHQQLKTKFMIEPVQWHIRSGTLPGGMSFDRITGEFSGTPAKVSRTVLGVEAKDAAGQSDNRDLKIRVLPAVLRRIDPDKHTVALWDWQGPSGKLIPEIMGNQELTLTWVNTKGDTRMFRPGWGRYPHFIGGGEGGFVGPQHNDKVDLRTCPEQWTVEAWVRRGGPVNRYGKVFDFGHVCGTYDNTERGVWELYLSDHNSPDGSMAPGVHFLGAQPDQALKDLHPWTRPKGIVADQADVGISDTQWHHVAWQYNYAEDLHQLFLDGKLIWQMCSPGGRQLVNNRQHDAQFSICTRLRGFARYGGSFNWLGWGNFFGDIGEIRISNRRRYDDLPHK